MRAHVQSLWVLILLVLASTAACGGNGGQGNNNLNNNCPEGLEPRGPACVPVFDECAGPNERAVPGGGCEPVGVAQCAQGFVSDGEGGCDPILPADPCPTGTMEILGQTECQPVGVPQCADGFVPDGTGGCEPVLPSNPCPSGTIEILGHADCQPLGDCGTGTWGTITPDSTTVFVDQGYGGGDSDGSDASPFTTIADALAVVQPSGQIAVAAGDYAERLTINQPVRLVGRCAELVTLRGITFLGEPRPPVRINAGGSASVVRGVTLTGDGEGLQVAGAQDVEVQEVQVAGTGSNAVVVALDGSASFWRVSIKGCGSSGIISAGSVTEISESIVADTHMQGGEPYGRGIEAQCLPNGPCGRLTVDRSIVRNNRDVGIHVFGVETRVQSSLVSDNLPMTSGDPGGWGIGAQCDMDSTCAILTVEDSVVQNNTGVGVFVMGGDAVVRSSTVRDTGPRHNDDRAGYGISALCTTDGDCATVRVESSLLEANTEVGIAVKGADVTVLTTVVRNTQPSALDDTLGVGVGTECHSQAVGCGTVTVERSLFEGNSETGIALEGTDATVLYSVIEDTVSRPDDTFGRGISAQCSASAEVCGHLNVEHSLIQRNPETGIFLVGVDGRLSSSVVRETVGTPAGGLYGFGIVAVCDTDVNACGNLTIEYSVVERNRAVGVYASGRQLNVLSTVVRDTLPQASDQQSGRGIEVRCDVNVGPCGTLNVQDSLVECNRDVGIMVFGVETSLVSTMVRDTLPQESDNSMGRGIGVQCDYDLNICSTISLDRCLIHNNGSDGIMVFGANAAVTSTVVRNPHPDLSPSGAGMTFLCDHQAEHACGTAAVADSLVSSAHHHGIGVFGVEAWMDSVAVMNTRPCDQDECADDYGQGVFALCHEDTSACATLEMTSCLVESSSSAGVAVQGVSGSIRASAVSAVSPRPMDNGFGYGVQVESTEPSGAVTFDVTSCLIRDASLSGILFMGAAGTVSRSVISGGAYPVAASVGSQPVIADDNDLSGTVQDELYWGNMDPSPAPAPSLPTQNVENPTP